MNFGTFTFRSTYGKGTLHTPDGDLCLYREEARAYCQGARLPYHEVPFAPTTQWQDASWNTVLPILLVMEHEGGSFVSHLAKAWLRADITHEAVLRRSFADLLDQYAEAAKQRA